MEWCKGYASRLTSTLRYEVKLAKWASKTRTLHACFLFLFCCPIRTRSALWYFRKWYDHIINKMVTSHSFWVLLEIRNFSCLSVFLSRIHEHITVQNHAGKPIWHSAHPSVFISAQRLPYLFSLSNPQLRIKRQRRTFWILDFKFAHHYANSISGLWLMIYYRP